MLLPKLWILVLLFASSERLKGWFISLKSKMRESLPFPTSIKRVIPFGLNVSVKIIAVRLNSLLKELIKKPVKTWKNNLILNHLEKGVAKVAPFFV